MKPKVYLAGPIQGQPYGAISDWREYAADSLSDVATCYSPLRGKAALMPTQVVVENYALSPLHSRKGVVERDFHDVRLSDLVLVNFVGFTDVSKGTLVEIGMAYALRKPIVVAMNEGNVHDHPFVTETASFVVDNLNDAIAIVRTYFEP